MVKKLITIFLIANCSLTFAQTIKTDVLVIGSSASGVAAAMQCARSKVKTILAVQDSSLGNFHGTEMISVETSRNIPSGIWGEFRKHIQDFYKKTPGYDTAYNAPLKFEPAAASSILKKITDTIKGLTIYREQVFSTIKKDGDKWDITFSRNDKTVKVIARVVIDGTENGGVVAKAGAKFPPPLDNTKDNSQSNDYRTSIAGGEALPGQSYNDVNTLKNNYLPYPAWCSPINSVLIKGADNLFVTEKMLPGNVSYQYLPVRLNLGQGIGTIAAYCAFFKTTTNSLNARVIQSELLDFKAYLLPFADITPKDHDWRAIQQVCTTGLLKGVLQSYEKQMQFLFKPDSSVNTIEVQPILTEIYTRAFLWFGKEKPGEKFTLGNLLSFISDYTLTDPMVLKYRVQKEWTGYYKFKPGFDLNAPITRREFAVLANRFLNPFARTVDLNGRLVN
jgi:hypothetical protein